MSTTSPAIVTVPHDLDFSPLHDRMQWYVDENILPCANSLVMQGTDVLDVRCYGNLDQTSDRPLAPDSIFRMHSSTKLATSVAAMMLFEEGRFALDDPLANYLPEFTDMQVLKPDAETASDVEPAASPIRINQILSHSAGLSYGFVEPTALIDKTYMAASLNPLGRGEMTLEGLCQELAKLPLAYHPGTSWRYSFATDVTARLIEVLSGQRFDAFLQERIFNPLGMSDTGFFVPEDKLDRFTAMYAPTDLLKPMEPGLTLADDPLDSANARQPTFLSGGGGLMSTLIDYLAFTRMLINDGEWAGTRLLKKDTLALMRTNQLADGAGVKFPMWEMKDTVFGLGFALKQGPANGEPATAAGEYHWGGMAGTHIWVSPNAGISGICMTQRMPGFWHPFSHDFKRLAYEIAGR